MRKFWNTIIPLAAAAMLAGVAAMNRPSSALSATQGQTRQPGKNKAAARPTTRPAGAGRRGVLNPVGARSMRPPTKLTDEQEKEVLAYLNSRRPEIYKEVLAQQKKDPARYRRTLGRIYPFIVKMRKLPEPVARAYETLQQTHVTLWRLAREYNSAKTADKKQDVESRMVAQARKQFEAEQLVRGQRLANLEEQIRNLKAELARRANDRETVIKETLERFKRGVKRYRKSGEKSDRPRPSHTRKTGKTKD